MMWFIALYGFICTMVGLYVGHRRGRRSAMLRGGQLYAFPPGIKFGVVRERPYPNVKVGP